MCLFFGDCDRNPRIRVLKQIVAASRGLAIPKLDGLSSGGSSDSLSLDEVANEDLNFKMPRYSKLLCFE